MTSLENISPLVLKSVVRELQDMQREPLEGIKVLINDDDLTDVQAFIQGPAGTPFEGGCFRIRLQLCPDFPNVPPKGMFLTKVFHPNVSTAGEICVNTLKKDWKKDLGLKHVLLTIKCLLIVPNAESALNDEAGKLILEDFAEYENMARLWTSMYARGNEFKPAEAAAPAATEAKTAAPTIVKKIANGGVDAKKRNLRRL